MKQVVELEEAVAVVADSYWRARKALAALGPVYDDAGHGDVSSETIFAAFDAALGPAPEMPAEAATVITADYRVPFLATPRWSRWRARCASRTAARTCGPAPRIR